MKFELPVVYSIFGCTMKQTMSELRTVGSYMNALVDLARTAVPNPNEEQKAKVIASVTAVRAAFSNLVGSNSRMENWDTDATLMNNPEFADFYQMAYFFKDEGDKLIPRKLMCMSPIQILVRNLVKLRC
jgi:hypothetical protein